MQKINIIVLLVFIVSFFNFNLASVYPWGSYARGVGAG